MRCSVATPEELEGYTKMVGMFKQAYPKWDGAITPETSVKMMLDVFARAGLEQNGQMISHHGNKEWL